MKKVHLEYDVHLESLLSFFFSHIIPSLIRSYTYIHCNSIDHKLSAIVPRKVRVDRLLQRVAPTFWATGKNEAYYTTRLYQNQVVLENSSGGNGADTSTPNSARSSKMIYALLVLLLYHYLPFLPFFFSLSDSSPSKRASISQSPSRRDSIVSKNNEVVLMSPVSGGIATDNAKKVLHAYFL